MAFKVHFLDGSNRKAFLSKILKLGGQGSVVVLSHFEYETHQGRTFYFDYADTTMADSDTIIVAFKTGRTNVVHFTLGYNMLLAGHIELWEKPTWTTNTGTATAIINRKRHGFVAVSEMMEDKTTTPTFSANNKLLVNPTGLDTGSATRLRNRYSFASRSVNAEEAFEAAKEYMLKKNTTYAVVLTSDAASNTGQLVLNWIEGEGDKEVA